MIKQTVLKFTGALGLLGFSRVNEKGEGDSGNSSRSSSSGDDDGGAKAIYTTTGVLTPKN